MAKTRVARASLLDRITALQRQMEGTTQEEIDAALADVRRDRERNTSAKDPAANRSGKEPTRRRKSA